ncbi:hypothetical protein [Caballeronia sp. DA-9]|uniref:hypothetical protein n=1 Tax=Caballeronia sp. DA-9 TaxID=3436237 RepID=UPI003F66347B
MKRKPSNIRPAADRYCEKVEAALVKKFNRSAEVAAKWVDDDYDSLMDALDAGQSVDQAAHELFMKKVKI